MGFVTLDIDGKQIELDTTTAGRIADHERLQGTELRGLLYYGISDADLIVVDPDPDLRQRLYDAAAGVASSDDPPPPFRMPLLELFDALRAGGARASLVEEESGRRAEK